MQRHVRRLFLAPLAFACALAPSIATADILPQPRRTPKYHLEGNRVVLPAGLEVKFDKGKETWVPSSLRAIARLTEYLKDKPYVSTLRIEAHVGPTEGLADAAAQVISEARALRVAREMVAMGVDCKRLLPVGFGTTKPVAPAKSPSNTRVEAHNAALRGKAIGGMPLDGGGKVAGDPCAE